MKAFRSLQLLTLACLFVLFVPACKKDKEDQPDPPNSGIPATTSGGLVTATISGSSYEATEFNRARIGTNGTMWFSTEDTDSERYMFVYISDFSGSISYSIHPDYSNSASYHTEQDLFDTNYGGSGTLTVSSHNQSNQTLSGMFNFIASAFNTPANYVEVTNGEFSNIPLIHIPDLESGQAMYYIGGDWDVEEAVSAQVRITDHYRFVVDIDQENTRWRFHTYANPTGDPLSINSGTLLFQPFNTGDLNLSTNNPGVEITEYNEAEGYVSGRIYRTDFDVDIRFNRIPLVLPTEVPPGAAVLNTPEGPISFENAEYISGSGSYRLEATNAANQKIVLETQESPDDMPPHGYGLNATVEFYEMAEGPITYIQSGYWQRYSASPGWHIGFVSLDEEYSVKGFHVP